MKQNNNISIWDKLEILLNICSKTLRGFLFKLKLKKSSGLLLVGKNVKVTHGRHIRCGSFVKFEDYSEIQGLSSDGVVFGDHVTIGRGVMIRPSGYYGTDLGKGLVVGNNSSIGPYGYIGCSGKIVIGNNVMIGPKCSLFAENHVFSDNSKSIRSQGVLQKGITIEDNCWIGSNVIILDGVSIGEGTVIGAGAVISKSVEKNSVVIDKRNKSIRNR